VGLDGVVLGIKVFCCREGVFGGRLDGIGNGEREFLADGFGLDRFGFALMRT